MPVMHSYIEEVVVKNPNMKWRIVSLTEVKHFEISDNLKIS